MFWRKDMPFGGYYKHISISDPTLTSKTVILTAKWTNFRSKFSSLYNEVPQ